MSGYLQRVAMSAARTERRVQPLVGGMYTRQPAQAIEEGATTIVPRSGEVHMTAAPSTSHLPAAEARAASQRSYRDELKVEETMVRSAAAEPLAEPMPEEPRRRPLPVSVEQDSGFALKREERIERGGSPVRRMEGPAAPDLLVALKQFIERPADAQPGAQGNAQTPAGEISPVEAEERGASKPLVDASLARPASAGAVRTFAQPQAAQPQTPSPVRAGGNDIQIHIGRIEVIAVPQQVASRPAAAPARRGPSLEEYLQRRDRRSR